MVIIIPNLISSVEPEPRSQFLRIYTVSCIHNKQKHLPSWQREYTALRYFLYLCYLKRRPQSALKHLRCSLWPHMLPIERYILNQIPWPVRGNTCCKYLEQELISQLREDQLCQSSTCGINCTPAQSLTLVVSPNFSFLFATHLGILKLSKWDSTLWTSSSTASSAHAGEILSCIFCKQNAQKIHTIQIVLVCKLSHISRIA